ncbi:MAG: hypothetical protein HRT72_11400 [Flavobacteriales bacterium]|nr:hypothetical protein [Flavobacteriales bacterium]
MKTFKRKLLGKVGVDSGMLCIHDPCYDKASIKKLGIEFQSGYGDGLYSVFGIENLDGRIIKVEIIMGEHLIDNDGLVFTDYDETEKGNPKDNGEKISLFDQIG